MVAGETATATRSGLAAGALWQGVEPERPRGPRAPTASQLSTHRGLGKGVGMLSLLCMAGRRTETWAQTFREAGERAGNPTWRGEARVMV